ncbi:MAG: hypothetical protein LBM99_02650, partial [Bacillales bacterium]|nr:hypothetical protein [Bacillales bacterium]
MRTELTVDSKLRQQKTAKILGTTANYIFLTIMALFIIIPFYWMINTSLKSGIEAEAFPPTLYPSTGVHFENFFNAIFLDSNGDGIIDSNFAVYFLNTLGVGIIETIIGTVLVI